MEKNYTVKFDGGAEIHLRLRFDGQGIQNQEWRVIGNLDLLEAARRFKSELSGTIDAIRLPEGRDTSSILLRELALRIKNQWDEGDDDPEVCHCRKISQRSIERAIVLGAHSLEKVRKRTSANTGCGACMPDVQELIRKRLS